MVKFLHISDLHLGKRLRGFSLLEDQRDFLFEKTIPLLKEKGIDILVIAGDIYDLPSPSQDAVVLLDKFLTACAKEDIRVLMIPGNHDSSLRLSYGSHLFQDKGIHIVTDLQDALKPIEIDGARFYLLPFFKHHDVNGLFDESFKDYASAMEFLIKKMELNHDFVNILVAHQLVLPSKGELEFGGSEEVVVGNVGNIPSSLFQDFDYVALGHIHKQQKVGENAFYCGSPIKYHVDEFKHKKDFYIVSVDSNKVIIDQIPIHALHELRVLEGNYIDIIALPPSEDYIYVRLLDSSYIENAMDAIRDTVFPRCLGLEYPNIGSLAAEEESVPAFDAEHPEDLFPKFYDMVMGQELTQFQRDVVSETLEQSKEGQR